MKVHIWVHGALILCLWQFPTETAGQSCPLPLTEPSLRPRDRLQASGPLAMETSDSAKLRGTSDYKADGRWEAPGQPPTPPTATPVFAQWTQTYDARGLLHVFGVAGDGSVWHFREPGTVRQWVVEPLGGKASSVPSASLTPTGLLQAWIVGPEHAVWSNRQKSPNGGWT